MAKRKRKHTRKHAHLGNGLDMRKAIKPIETKQAETYTDTEGKRHHVVSLPEPDIEIPKAKPKRVQTRPKLSPHGETGNADIYVDGVHGELGKKSIDPRAPFQLVPELRSQLIADVVIEWVSNPTHNIGYIRFDQVRDYFDRCWSFYQCIREVFLELGITTHVVWHNPKAYKDTVFIIREGWDTPYKRRILETQPDSDMSFRLSYEKMVQAYNAGNKSYLDAIERHEARERNKAYINPAAHRKLGTIADRAGLKPNQYISER
jgi:hypothetical protein